MKSNACAAEEKHSTGTEPKNLRLQKSLYREVAFYCDFECLGHKNRLFAEKKIQHHGKKTKMIEEEYFPQDTWIRKSFHRALMKFKRENSC